MARGEGWTFRIVDAVAEGVRRRSRHALAQARGEEAGDGALRPLRQKRIAVTWGKEGTETHGTWGMKFEGVIPA